MTHSTALDALVQRLSSLNTSTSAPNLSEETAAAALSVLLIDFEPLRDDLKAHYASWAAGKRAPRQPWEPTDLLRALVLGAMLGITSPHALRKTLQQQPLLAVCAGFEPQTLPGTTTFYDFIQRIERGPCNPDQHPNTPPRPRLHLRDTARERALRKAQHADQAPLAAEVQRVIERIHAQQPPQSTRAARLNDLLQRCAVLPSARRGLLAAASRLTVAIDATSLPSGAAPHGHKACDCTSRRCTCPRRYADPDAQWGFDPYRDTFFFGYKLSLAATTHHALDLPIAFQAVPANVPDVLVAPTLIEQLIHRWSTTPWKLHNLLADTGYDAAALHTLCTRNAIRPLIPLHPNTPTPHLDGLPLDPSGAPRCKGGIPMIRHGKSPNQRAVIFHCPAKPVGREDGRNVRKVDLARCPLGSLCEPQSKMGPLAYVDLETHGRLSPEVPRDSPAFKALYAQRSGVERLNSQLKHACGPRPFRSQARLEVWTFTWCLGRHARAWRLHHFGSRLPSTLPELLECATRLLAAAQEVNNSS